MRGIYTHTDSQSQVLGIKLHKAVFKKLTVPQTVKKIPRILWNLMDHYCVHNSTPLVLSQTNPIPTLPFHFFNVDFRITV